MTNINITLTCILLVAIPIASIFGIVSYGPLDYITDTQLHFYENRVAHEKVVTHLSDDEIEKSSKKYGATKSEYKNALVIQHAVKNIGLSMSISEILQLSDYEIIKLSRSYFAWLKTQMSEDEFKQLRSDFLATFKTAPKTTSQPIST